MKTKYVPAIALCLLTLCCWTFILRAAERPAAVAEYVTIHWAGKENTHIIRPGGDVEFIGGQLRQIRRPERADERAFYMNVARTA
jgi:hypothetical protein